MLSKACENILLNTKRFPAFWKRVSIIFVPTSLVHYLESWDQLLSIRFGPYMVLDSRCGQKLRVLKGMARWGMGYGEKLNNDFWSLVHDSLQSLALPLRFFKKVQKVKKKKKKKINYKISLKYVAFMLHYFFEALEMGWRCSKSHPAWP